MSDLPAGFREREHTADWQLEVWGPDLPALFAQAAQGMYALADAGLKSGPRQARSLQLNAPDAESLLVAFLEELLFFAESENLAFDQFHIKIEDHHLEAVMEGASFSKLSKEIKAVTYHDLSIQQGPRGLEVKIVFDV
jgi:SHS2 domain-containing protein